MSVIINDFELVPETPPETPPGEAAAPEPAGPAPSLTPLDIRDILRRQADRLARVQAY
jgi:hypothetical protein